MTPYEGKRKTRGNLGHGNGLESHSSAEPPSNRIQELMKLHFETKFQPLPAIENVATPTESNDELTDDGDDSIGDWEGFPEIDADLVEVVQQGPEVITESSLDSKELRVFMVGAYLQYFGIFLISFCSRTNHLYQAKIHLMSSHLCHTKEIPKTLWRKPI